MVFLLEKNFKELEEVISSLFGRIKNKQREQTMYEYPKHHPWGPKQLKKIVHIALVGDDAQSLRLVFPAPYNIKHSGTTVSCDCSI